MLNPSLQQELDQLQGVYELITEFLVNYSFQLVGATLIFLAGLWLAGKVAKLVSNQFEKHHIDVTLSNFVTNLVRIIIIVMVAIIALGKLGISVTPMVAAIGAASLGAGLALQGMLANYAAGITIIVTRPFVVGNTISVQGVTGVVKDIHLGLTMLTNEEGELISIPNKHIIGEIIHNSNASKLVESQINIGHKGDPEVAIAAINQVLSQYQTQAELSPQIGINAFNELGIEIGVRYWVATERYFQEKYQLNLAIYRALKQANIQISCPIKEIHVQNSH